MPRSVLLLVNRSKPDAVAALDDVHALIRAHALIAAELDANGGPIPDAMGADIVMALGGDGTLLAQARRCAHLCLPIIGVNFGKLGFLAQFDAAALAKHAPDILGRGAIKTETRSMLRVRVRTPGGADRFDAVALNDAVITAGPPYRMLSLALTIDGEPGPTWRGDGVVVATSIGSTGHNVSAGGPILTPELDSLAITPIAAHSLAFRPIVVGGKRTLEITLERGNREGDEGTTLVLDGQERVLLHEGERVVLQGAGRAARLVRNPDWSYWQTLLGKLHWAAAPGQDEGVAGGGRG